MWRFVSFVGCVVVLAVGASAYSLPGATQMRASLPGDSGDGESSESVALLLTGGALLGAAWAARRHSRIRS